ncbi:hypothetical protein [Streptomyces sp. Ag109_G2-15]|uniref:hypothetical protein n=1 Tax=Streptomyces sp. Ag109_G2-15 TaxID=1938850 RepID=UPI000BD7EBE0|nr:hypothetical protein [Streptomyces sp. Ag109_G2-15]SOE07194.1 hypothetical protein SAMN06272765_8076 [Streptomyces sp. Ag109_G2-15]
MRRGLVAVAVLAAVTAVGCDDGTGVRVVVKGAAPATPYSGPLYVPTKAVDGSGPRSLRLASGAAGRALECDGEIFDGGGPDGWSKSDGGDTPEAGLKLYFDMAQPAQPDHGYRVERREADRVLYSFDVKGRTKVAVVVAKDQKDRPGWGPETNASCDPAELPAKFTAAQGWEIWTDRNGRRVPVSRLSSSPGAEHCGWQSGHLLTLGERTYLRDPDGVLGRDGLLKAPYRKDVTMPADARDTGYHYRGWHLWLTDDKETAYVRTADGVEAWPQEKHGVGCQ